MQFINPFAPLPSATNTGGFSGADMPYTTDMVTDTTPEAPARVSQFKAPKLFKEEQAYFDDAINAGVDEKEVRITLNKNRERYGRIKFSPEELNILHASQEAGDTVEQGMKKINEYRAYESAPLPAKIAKNVLDIGASTVRETGEKTMGALAGVSSLVGADKLAKSFQEEANVYKGYAHETSQTLGGKTGELAANVGMAVGAMGPKAFTNVGSKFLPNAIQGGIAGARLGAAENLASEGENATLGGVAGSAGKSALVGGAVQGGVVKGLDIAGKAAVVPIGQAIKGIKQATDKVSKAGKSAVQAITPSGENISTRANRFNALDEEKFIKTTGETPGQFATSRGMTKVGDQAVEEAVANFEKSKFQADKAFELIDGNFRYSGEGEDLVKTMIDDLVTRLKNVKSPDSARVEGLKSKYESQGLTMTEINQVKRDYAKNFKYTFDQMGSEPAMRSTNLQNALREWQFGVAKENGLSNIAEINKNTQGWKMYADSLAKKNNRSVANNVMGLTDMVSLAGGSVSNIALFLGKKTLESNRIKERLIKRFSKQTKSAIVSPSTESIKKSNIEKKYANPTNIFRSGDVAGGKSMVKPAGLLPKPSEKFIQRNEQKQLSKKILKENEDKARVVQQPEVTARSKIVNQSPLKSQGGYINPSEIGKSVKEAVSKGKTVLKSTLSASLNANKEARQFYDDLVKAGNPPIVAQRETAKRFGTLKAMSASKAGTKEQRKKIAPKTKVSPKK